MDQKKCRIWTLFTQCKVKIYMLISTNEYQKIIMKQNLKFVKQNNLVIFSERLGNIFNVFFIQISTVQFELLRFMNICFLYSNTTSNTIILNAIINIESYTI